VDVNWSLKPADLQRRLDDFWGLSAQKIDAITTRGEFESGNPPVHTANGAYISRAWTDWTRGFYHGSSLLQFDGTDDEQHLEVGRTSTVKVMTSQLTDFGVHDHGFNIVSTYGNLWRLAKEGRIAEDINERRLYETALRVSGAVQANRWTDVGPGLGFIYSFNGPHSLFIDTIRSLRSLALAHVLGQVLRDHRERQISLLDRLKQHAVITARHCVYYGDGKDIYDVRGRVAHEALFNIGDGSFRAPSSQQGSVLDLDARAGVGCLRLC
jgi:unsaturated chondroitin disaccharide hydrolase